MTELGNRLRLAREENNLTLDELQNITRIQKRYLKGIEEGNYDIMPGKFYTRAFIKQYTEAVGLDPSEIFEQYKNEIPLAYEEDLPEQLSRIQSRKSGSAATSKIWDLLPKILTAIFIIAALFVIWYLITNFLGNKDNPGVENNSPVDIHESDEITTPGDDTDENNQTTDENEDAIEEPIEEEMKQEITIVDTSGENTTYSLINTDEFQLEVKATSPGRSWVQVSNSNNQVIFSGELKDGAGETFDFSEETEVRVRSGSSPQTEIFVNGEKLEWESTRTVQNIYIQFTKEQGE